MSPLFVYICIVIRALNLKQENMATVTKGIDNTSAIIEIGTFNKFVSQKTKFTIPLAAKNPNGNTDFIVSGWKIRSFNLNDPTELKKYMSFLPHGAELSRSRSSVMITKKDQLSDTEINQLKLFLNRTGYFIDKNDPSQFDRSTGERVGVNASAEYWFEDLRESRVSEEALIEETVAINTALMNMKSDAATLRDAIYLTGGKPNEDDSESDLYYSLIVSLIKESNPVKRKAFIAYYVDKKVSKEYLEAKKWLNKGLKHDVVSLHGNTYMFGPDRLGENEEQTIKFIIANNTTRRLLINAISNKSNLLEDVNAAKMEFSKEDESASEDYSEEARAIEYVKNRSKEIGLTGNPGPMFKSCNTLSEAVKKYNTKLKEANLPNPVFLSEDLVLEEIKAKS
jgi:hypothetical protein